MVGPWHSVLNFRSNVLKLLAKADPPAITPTGRHWPITRRDGTGPQIRTSKRPGKSM